jgi:hypothetical protein
MSDIALLESFRRLTCTANYSRKVDALFKDFLLSPMSLDFAATGQLSPRAADEVPAQVSPLLSAVAQSPEFPELAAFGEV